MVKSTINAQILADAKGRLNQWVLNEKKCITVPYLSRHTNLKAKDAIGLMKEFYIESSAKGLSACYSVLAQSAVDGPAKAGLLCKKVLLIREIELKEIRANNFVISEQIYSVQSSPVEDLKLITDVDWYDVPEDQKWVLKTEDQRASPETSTSAGEIKTIVQPDKNRKIDSMFAAGNTKKASPNTTTPKKKSPAKKESEDSTPPKKRRPKIIIDGEDEAGDQTKAEPMAPSTSKNTPEKPDKHFDDFINQSNDLFCTEESPEKMGIDFMDVSEPMEPSKKKIKTTSKKSKPVKNIDFMEVDEKPVKPSQKPVVVDDDDDIIEPKRIIRHARVTETFVDEDGFLVTTQVNKAIETDEIQVPTKRVVLQPKPTNVSNAAGKKKKGPQAVNKDQSKISSFFAKK